MLSPIFLFHFLFGFFLGSICPTSFSLVSNFFVWNNLFILSLLVALEYLNMKFLRYGKLGFLFGLFVDAFKVGS